MDDIKTYSSKDVAKRLSVEPVTVRKYSQMLENQGYVFQKDDKNWRQYSEDDIAYLEYICNMRSAGKTLDESVERVASLYRSNLNISNTAISLQEEKQNILFEFMKQQQELNQKILQKLEDQEQRQIERDNNLMIALNQSLETQKQLAATEQKKWWKFWK